MAIDVDGTEELHIAFDEEKDQNTGPYRVTIVFEDGRLMEGATKSWRAKTERAPLQRPTARHSSQRSPSVAVDLVGKNKKKGANGAKDMALTVKAGKGRHQGDGPRRQRRRRLGHAGRQQRQVALGVREAASSSTRPTERSSSTSTAQRPISC
ncbi:MAG: hypothetical protein ACLUEQ_07730 [Cloacibacillus evryensis]